MPKQTPDKNGTQQYDDKVDKDDMLDTKYPGVSDEDDEDEK